jgi:hypothetical protein
MTDRYDALAGEIMRMIMGGHGLIAIAIGLGMHRKGSRARV